jgi:predicted permease
VTGPERRSRFARVFRLAGREPPLTADVDAEIETHLAELTDWLIARGATPAAARAEALRRFGDRSRFQSELRSIDESAGRRRRIGTGLVGWYRDLVVAWRGLRRSPGSAAVIVGTLGVALGANATMFGVIDRLLLSPPAGVTAPGAVRRIEAVRWSEGGVSHAWDNISYPSFVGLRDGGTGFSHVAAIFPARLSYGLGRDARQVDAVFATGQYFDLLGVTPAIGRLFHEAEDGPPRGAAVAVLSYRFWREGLGSDPAAVGRSVFLNGQSFEIIGVAARSFGGSELAPVDLWLPFSTVEPIVQASSEWRTGWGFQWITALARLKPGVSEPTALRLATQGYRAVNAGHSTMEAGATLILRRLEAYSDEDDGGGRIALWLYGVTIVVLLIACANVATVVLARGASRRSEMAVRRALGVSSARLARHFLIETALIMALGLGLGLLVTWWGGLFVRARLLGGVIWDSAPVNLRVLATTAGAAVVAGLLASLLPLVKTARVDVLAALHGAGRSTRSSRGGRRILLLAQTTLCTSLVALAGLFLVSLSRVNRIEVGIDWQHTLLAAVDLNGLGIPDEQIRQFYDQAAERVRRLPGVAAAGVTFPAPFRGNIGGRMSVPGRDSLPRLQGGGPYWFEVGPGALEAYGVRLVDGRLFTEADRRGSAPVVVVTQRTAEMLWPGGRAIGKCVIVGADTMPCREIVGVVADVNRQGFDEEPFYLFFSVITQEPAPHTPQFLVVRARPGAGDLTASIREALRRSDLPYVQITTYRDLLARQSRPWRLGAALLAVFAGLSLLIAGIGLYGAVAVAVSERTRELGLRAALGATPGRLLRAVTEAGLAIAAGGAALGIALAFVAGRRVEPLLYHTSATNPAVLAGALLVVVTTSLIAAWLPGRRATRLDPVQALRVE